MLVLVTMLLVGCGLSPLADVPRETADTGPGSVVLGGVEVTPAELDFGDVPVATEVYGQVTVLNGTEGPLTVEAVEVSGSDFWLDSAVSFPRGLEAGGELALSIGFAPSWTGEHTGRLEIAVEGEPEPAVVSLTGRGTSGGGGDDTGGGTPGAPVVASPSAIDFGEVETNATSSQLVVLENTGTASLLLEDIVSSEAAFEVVSDINLPSVLDPGEQEQFSIEFAPDEERTYSGVVTITHDAGDPVQIPVTGIGIEPSCTVCDPTISVSPTSLSFTSLLGIPDEQVLTIRNESDVDLVITDIYVSNDSSGGTFSLTGLSATTLSPWATLAGTVTYRCTDPVCVDVAVEFTDTNILHVKSNDPRNPDVKVQLSGTGFSL